MTIVKFIEREVVVQFESSEKPHNVDDICPISYVPVNELYDPIIVVQTNYIYSKAALAKWVMQKIKSGHDISDPITTQLLPTAIIVEPRLTPALYARRSIANVINMDYVFVFVLLAFIFLAAYGCITKDEDSSTIESEETLFVMRLLIRAALLIATAEIISENVAGCSLTDTIRQCIYKPNIDVEETIAKWFEENTVMYQPEEVNEEAEKDMQDLEPGATSLSPI